MLVFADDAALARLVIAATQRRAHVYRLEAFRSRGRGHARAASTCYPPPPPLLHAPFAALVAAQSPTAAPRLNCSPRLATAAPKRSCSRTASPSRRWSNWRAPGSRVRRPSASSPGGRATEVGRVRITAAGRRAGSAPEL